ncbi:MAG TPA: CAP domain-containing protein [Phycisphaerae bacterium]|nr:CAP domain-containing protein [Phycisphaerae bacterium]HOJ74415.1 CAP domain-containing protein [Phycisphaerae bacterium]HOM52904.1 CAP domain-containing protein [Phycisphaerae bacterium]HON67914.1 CAP domain-containing protein [Phycisphaerae bacterium]HOQ85749.1 CAP domain-containing protein [Phycisphaerae bacterium]
MSRSHSKHSLAHWCLLGLPLLLLAGCPAADGTAPKTPVLGLTLKEDHPSGTAIVPTNNDVLVEQVLRLINERRTRIGLNELTLNPVLTRVAEDYCVEMIEKGFFAHENPYTGEGPGERAYKADYVFVQVGENLAAGQETAEQVVSEWMASPEHREIILGIHWREIGIGVRLGGEYNVYWVLEFGNPP